jgi:hypothetical protein
MSFYYAIGFTDRTKAEVIRPSDYLSVELPYEFLRRLLSMTSSCRLANRLTDALHPFL